MKKCIRCGTDLPPAGECARCAGDGPTPPHGIPRIPELELQLDRRTRPLPPPQLPGMPPPPPGDFLKAPTASNVSARAARDPFSFAQADAETPSAHDAPTRIGPMPIAVPARPAPKAPPPPPRVGFASTRPADEPLPLPAELKSELGLFDDDLRPVARAEAPRSPAATAPSPPTPTVAPNLVAPSAAPSIAPSIAPAVLPQPPLAPAAPLPTKSSEPATAAPLPRPAPSPVSGPSPFVAQLPLRKTAEPPRENALTAARQAPVRSAAVREEEIHFRRAALWRRLLAGTVDTSALVLLSGAYLAIAASAAGIRPGPAPSGGLDLLAHLLQAWAPVLLPGAGVALSLGVAYSAIFAMLLGGRSPGRLLAGIRLVDGSGAPPGPVRALVRALLSVASLALLCAGFWLSLFDRRGQTLHDKLSRTFVVQPSRGTRGPSAT